MAGRSEGTEMYSSLILCILLSLLWVPFHLCPFQSMDYGDGGERTESKDGTRRKRRIKKDLNRKLEKDSRETAKSDGVGSTPPQMRGGTQLPLPSSPPPCQHCLLSVSSTLHLHFPLQWMSVFVPVMPEKVPKIHRESLVKWYLELAPEQKLL